MRSPICGARGGASARSRSRRRRRRSVAPLSSPRLARLSRPALGRRSLSARSQLLLSTARRFKTDFFIGPSSAQRRRNCGVGRVVLREAVFLAPASVPSRAGGGVPALDPRRPACPLHHRLHGDPAPRRRCRRRKHGLPCVLVHAQCRSQQGPQDFAHQGRTGTRHPAQ